MKIAASRGASNPARLITRLKLWITLQHSGSRHLIRRVSAGLERVRNEVFCRAAALYDARAQSTLKMTCRNLC
jgi:hypothetical protein